MAVEVAIDIQGVEDFVSAVQKLDVALQEQVRNWLYAWAQRVEVETERQAPVRTGYLQSTIYAKAKDWNIELGASAAYAYFVEFGTRYMRAHPFLYPAVQQFLPELESNIIKGILQAKSEAGF